MAKMENEEIRGGNMRVLKCDNCGEVVNDTWAAAEHWDEAGHNQFSFTEDGLFPIHLEPNCRWCINLVNIQYLAKGWYMGCKYHLLPVTCGSFEEISE
jgi:hypothetical protein